jgi:hypothetical protein
VPLSAEPLAAPVEGKAVYLVGRDLWIAPLDGSRAPIQLTTGSIGAGYAGTVTDAAGTMRI